MKLPVFRSALRVRLVLIALIALLSTAGYLLTSAAITSDRNHAAERHAKLDALRLQALLDRARGYVAGLATILGDEPPGEPTFARVAGSTTGSAGLLDALWIAQRAGGAKLIATFTTQTRPELRPGVDISNWQGLAQGIRTRRTSSAVGASGVGSLGGEPGFYLVERAKIGRGPSTSGYLAVFVPRSWLMLGLNDDPARSRSATTVSSSSARSAARQRRASTSSHSTARGASASPRPRHHAFNRCSRGWH